MFSSKQSIVSLNPSSIPSCFFVLKPNFSPPPGSQQSWKDLSYADLAFRILSLYISPDEIPSADLKDIIDRSYSTFRAQDVVPLEHLHDNLYLLELFHGPSYSFKDCAS